MDELQQTKLELNRARAINALIGRGVDHKTAAFAVRGDNRITADGYADLDGLPFVDDQGSDPAELFAAKVLEEIPGHVSGRTRSAMTDREKAHYIRDHGYDAYQNLPQ